MASNSAIATVVILASFMFGCCLASTVVVGGDVGWSYGVNYTDWSVKHGVFYVNDTLVFKNDNTSSEPHSVYLLPNILSYVQCDFTQAQLLSKASEVAGDGFSYELTTVLRPQYFASGEGSGADCSVGLMKFVALPLPRLIS